MPLLPLYRIFLLAGIFLYASANGIVLAGPLSSKAILRSARCASYLDGVRPWHSYKRISAASNEQANQSLANFRNVFFNQHDGSSATRQIFTTSDLAGEADMRMVAQQLQSLEDSVVKPANSDDPNSYDLVLGTQISGAAAIADFISESRETTANLSEVNGPAMNDRAALEASALKLHDSVAALVALSSTAFITSFIYNLIHLSSHALVMVPMIATMPLFIEMPIRLVTSYDRRTKSIETAIEEFLNHGAQARGWLYHSDHVYLGQALIDRLLKNPASTQLQSNQIMVAQSSRWTAARNFLVKQVQKSLNAPRQSLYPVFLLDQFIYIDANTGEPTLTIYLRTTQSKPPARQSSRQEDKATLTAPAPDAA